MFEKSKFFPTKLGSGAIITSIMIKENMPRIYLLSCPSGKISSTITDRLTTPAMESTQPDIELNISSLLYRMFALHITSPVKITYMNDTATIMEISMVIFLESVFTKDAILPSPSGSIIPAISFRASINTIS